jgi:hypothetical protein
MQVAQAMALAALAMAAAAVVVAIELFATGLCTFFKNSISTYENSNHRPIASFVQSALRTCCFERTDVRRSTHPKIHLPVAIFSHQQ